MAKTYWTYEKVKKEARRYKYRKDFIRNSNKAYGAACYYGWLDDVASHQKILWSKKWDKASCVNVALKFNHRTDFRKAFPGSYDSARKNGWLNEICAHMSDKSIKWTKVSIAKEAKKYKARGEFSNHSGSAYKAASNLGLLDEVCSHMKILHNGYYHCVYAIYNLSKNSAYIGITSQQFKNRVAQHKSKVDSTRSRSIAYLEGTKFEQQTEYIYSPDEVKDAEMEYFRLFELKGFKMLNSQQSLGSIGYSNPKWTFEMVSCEALKYKSRWEFQNNSKAYAAAKYRGWLDDVCSHMVHPKKEAGYWTIENCTNEAKLCSSVSEFRKKFPYGYKVICIKKWNDEVWKDLR